MQESAGTLLYRNTENGIEVLLVHPSGNYNRKAPWSIPKGLPEDGEELEAAARRETLEETGVLAGNLKAIGETIYQKSRKRIHAFAGEAPENAAPTCTSWECDRAEFVSLEKGRELIHPDQKVFLDRLAASFEAG